MSAPEVGRGSRNKAKEKEKEKERKQRATQKSQTERLKTVVRRLPPNLPEDVFWQSVQPWVSDDTVTWKEYNQGKFRKRLNKENIPSRAYIAFKNEELLATFSREYDGHVFRDKAGNESIAVVEFAPFQKVPSAKKADSRVATIDKDEDYLSFLESLKESASKPAEADAIETLGMFPYLNIQQAISYSSSRQYSTGCSAHYNSPVRSSQGGEVRAEGKRKHVAYTTTYPDTLQDTRKGLCCIRRR
ncbi:hypothetical protein NM688_g7909 [Phlebia brevispora]|uniref:Uncharacterized protein n=1 Tax=Phlebia brevispora TaxID=194682 RepID=A0ACC1RZR1_9APHY|nr:hypothetical protein NM688_g7909 [Phlebia brevispora]